MVNNKRVLSIALILLTALSCSRETISQEEAFLNKEGRILQVQAEGHAPDTKTQFQPGTKSVIWNIGDVISLFTDAGNKSDFTLVRGSGSATAYFMGDSVESTPYTAFYPASHDVSVAYNALYFHLPDTQEYAPDSFGPGASPMVAYVEDIDTPIQFRCCA